MDWTEKDVMEHAKALKSPFENIDQENPLNALRKAITNPVPKLPFPDIESGNGNRLS